NTRMDPEATRIVFESGIPITMYGYDVTYRVLYSKEFIQKMRDVGNRTSRMVADLLEFFMNAHNSMLTYIDLGDNAPIHDACAVAGVIAPEIVTDKRLMHVDVEVGGTVLDGATVCDYNNYLPLPKNVEVVYNMDGEKFLDMLLEAAKKCK
ncbi:MAG: nucleoside hydrolase, partial [Oscillospiraceae bacterium]|nr:nucleoside hydrolase [Oscillospiraceae bacterium]